MPSKNLPFGTRENTAQIHAFVIAANRLKALHFPEPTATLIIVNGGAVSAFVEALAVLRLNGVGESTIDNLISSTWGNS